MTTKYRLADVVARNRETPTFEIPTSEERHALTCGSLAKLVFEFDALPNGCNGERMWVRIIRAAPRSYIGELVSVPAFPDALGIRRGALVRFGPEHVAGVDSAQTRPS